MNIQTATVKHSLLNAVFAPEVRWYVSQSSLEVPSLKITNISLKPAWDCEALWIPIIIRDFFQTRWYFWDNIFPGSILPLYKM